jgi:hypothetical protein
MNIGTEECPICHACVPKGVTVPRGKKRKRPSSPEKHDLDESSFGPDAGLSTKLSALLKDVVAHTNGDKRYGRVLRVMKALSEPP